MAIYYPTEDQIIAKGPRMGMFYRRGDITPVTIAQIAKVAANNSAVPVTTAQVVKLISDSPWNQAHVEFGMTGYENYGFPGPQYKKKYSADPTSGPGTGSGWPTLWIPTADGKEPEEVFGKVIPTPVTPGVPGGGGTTPATPLTPQKAGFPWWLVMIGGGVLLVGWLTKKRKKGKRGHKRRPRYERKR